MKLHRPETRRKQQSREETSERNHEGVEKRPDESADDDPEPKIEDSQDTDNELPESSTGVLCNIGHEARGSLNLPFQSTAQEDQIPLRRFLRKSATAQVSSQLYPTIPPRDREDPRRRKDKKRLRTS